MSIEYKTFAVSEHALNPTLGSLTVNTNRAFTKLDGIIASFSRPDAFAPLSDGDEVPAQYILVTQQDDPNHTPDPSNPTAPVPQVTVRTRFLVSKEATWFEGIDGNHQTGIMKHDDVCEAFLSIGPRRYPVYPVQRLSEHYYRTQQLAGRLNSDAHNFGMNICDYKYNKFLLSWDLEKAHAGSGAQYTGENSRNNDLVTVHCKTLPWQRIRCSLQ